MKIFVSGEFTSYQAANYSYLNLLFSQWFVFRFGMLFLMCCPACFKELSLFFPVENQNGTKFSYAMGFDYLVTF